MDPKQVVTAYFTAINNKDYTAAWNIYSPIARPGETFDVFQQGFSDTVHVDVTITSVSANTVYVNFTATHTSGAQTTYSGYYSVDNGQFNAAKIQATGG